jgi:hypothetical protein
VFSLLLVNICDLVCCVLGRNAHTNHYNLLGMFVTHITYTQVGNPSMT